MSGHHNQSMRSSTLHSAPMRMSNQQIFVASSRSQLILKLCLRHIHRTAQVARSPDAPVNLDLFDVFVVGQCQAKILAKCVATLVKMRKFPYAIGIRQTAPMRFYSCHQALSATTSLIASSHPDILNTSPMQFGVPIVCGAKVYALSSTC